MAKPLLIDGKWRETGQTEAIRNPFDGSVVDEIALGGEREMDDAIAAAFAARRPLFALTNAARGVALDKIKDGIAARQSELARMICLESGKPIRDARVEVSRAVHVFQIAAEEARRFGAGETIALDRMESSAHRVGIVRRFPAGVVGAISPFNFPLNLVAHKVAPALAAACPVVLKPAHQTPLTSLLLAEIVAETHLPPGAFNVVHTPPAIGEMLATDPRVAVLSFTGSTRVGWHLKSLAAQKRVTLELGGNAAVIVEPDSDVNFAVARCVVGAFAFSGQVCISVQRIFVHASLFDDFCTRFCDAAQKLTMENPLSETTDLGPMLTEDAAKRTEKWVREATDGGAKLVLGNGKADGKWFAPTILTDTTATMAVNNEEAFAPVVTIEKYDDFDDGLARVNDSPFGLQAGIFTRDVNRIYQAFETLEVGGVIANDVPTYRIDHMPYGGVKNSGFGREGVKYAMEDMTELRLLALNLT